MSGTDYIRKKILDDLTGVGGVFAAGVVPVLPYRRSGRSRLARLRGDGRRLCPPAAGRRDGRGGCYGFCVNTTQITFGPATTDWGTINFSPSRMR
jgi:hypothetical protein